MYINVATVAPETAGMFGLLDSYAWHQEVSKSFHKSRRDAGYVFRCDTCDNGDILLSCYSQTAPMPTQVIEWRSIKISDRFFESEFYSFDLKVVPIKSLPKANGRGTKVSITDKSELAAWMERKAEENGFIFDKDTLVMTAPVSSSFQKKGMRGVHTSVTFQGNLTVTDKEKFCQSVIQGIGSAKGFGYGLMKLIPR